MDESACEKRINDLAIALSRMARVLGGGPPGGARLVFVTIDVATDAREAFIAEAGGQRATGHTMIGSLRNLHQVLRSACSRRVEEDQARTASLLAAMKGSE